MQGIYIFVSQSEGDLQIGTKRNRVVYIEPQVRLPYPADVPAAGFVARKLPRNAQEKVGDAVKVELAQRNALGVLVVAHSLHSPAESERVTPFDPDQFVAPLKGGVIERVGARRTNAALGSGQP